MRVLLEFTTNEDVTPELFAAKIAIACAYRGAIREGESVRAIDITPGFGYCDLYTHKGYIETDMGGMFEEPITVPDIESSFSEEYPL